MPHALLLLVVSTLVISAVIAAPKESTVQISQSPESPPVISRSTCASDEAFDHSTSKCYRVSTGQVVQKGPCLGRKMFVRMDFDETSGECICARPEQKCSRPVVPYSDDSSCQELFTKGPCADGQWLIVGTEKPSICTKNICSDAPLPQIKPVHNSSFHGEVFNFIHKDKCYTTETQAFCNEGYVARFEYDSWNPTCYRPEHLTCGLF